MTAIAQNLKRVLDTLPQGVELVAVSKYHPASAIRQAYDSGQRRFGESRLTELLSKESTLPADIEWHFIGHLQTNKVKKLVGHVALIESVDTLRLLHCIDQASQQAGIVTNVLMQVHVAQEETKFGFTPDELLTFFRNRAFETLRATHIRGLMAMASNTNDTKRVQTDFHTVASLMKQIMETCPDLQRFDRLSMGMSHDYPLAIAQGANLVRVGTAIFGVRQ